MNNSTTVSIQECSDDEDWKVKFLYVQTNSGKSSCCTKVMNWFKDKNDLWSQYNYVVQGPTRIQIHVVFLDPFLRVFENKNAIQESLS